MHWNFHDVRTGHSVGTIELPNIRMGIILIVDITRTENGVRLCINGDDVELTFSHIVDTKDYKFRCYKNLDKLSLFIS